MPPTRSMGPCRVSRTSADLQLASPLPVKSPVDGSLHLMLLRPGQEPAPLVLSPLGTVRGVTIGPDQVSFQSVEPAAYFSDHGGAGLGGMPEAGIGDIAGRTAYVLAGEAEIPEGTV